MAAKKSPAGNSGQKKGAAKKSASKGGAGLKKPAAKSSAGKTGKSPMSKAKSSSVKTEKKPAKKAEKKPEKTPEKKAAGKPEKKPAPAKAAAKKPEVKSAKKPGKGADKSSGEPQKVKFSINLAPSNYKRPVAPGVIISKTAAPVVTRVDPEQKAAAAKKAKKLAPKEIEAIREMLYSKRESILREMKNQVGDSLTRSSTVKTDAADRASDVYDGDVSYEMAKMGHQELQEIDAALQKIKAGTYGQCENCGEAISASRLKVKPFALMCTGCRQEKERGSGQNGNGTIWGFLDEENEYSQEEF